MPEITSPETVSATNSTPGGKKLAITLVKSGIGNQVRAKRTLSALGFTKVKQTIIQPDSPSIRGMLYVVSHLVSIKEIED